MFNLWLQGAAVVDDLELGALLEFVLGPLLVDPGKGRLATDMVALHDALEAHVEWGRDGDDAVDKMVEAIKIELGERKMKFLEGNKAALAAGMEAAKA